MHFMFFEYLKKWKWSGSPFWLVILPYDVAASHLLTAIGFQLFKASLLSESF